MGDEQERQVAANGVHGRSGGLGMGIGERAMSGGWVMLRGAFAAGVVLGATAAAAAGPTGAIFTTMPDGGVVNANVQYDYKQQVYLDGGPGRNAPSTAAGLDEGCYVFQVTDPSGAYLLSPDPSKCRVVKVNEKGVIARLVKPSELSSECNVPDLTTSYAGNGNAKALIECHQVPDASTSAAGAGPHDTNFDVDHHDDGAITIQLWPFNDTPNPGGVYKAWMEKLPSYLLKAGGSSDSSAPLDVVPVKNNSAKKVCPQGCFQRDAGFGAPRNDTKTDNFKVKGVPPRIEVVKYDDKDADGVLDPEDTLYTGWPVLVLEHLSDGSVVPHHGYTPFDTVVPRNTLVEVCEQYPFDDWVFSFVYVNGTPVTGTEYDKTYDGVDYRCVSFTTSNEDVTTEFAFGNWECGSKSGHKYVGISNACTSTCSDVPIEGWTICLLDGGGAVVDCAQTDADGYYEFYCPKPGSYFVCEGSAQGWTQTFPNDTVSDVCGSFVGPYSDHGYAITLSSGEVDTDNDFCNQPNGCTRTFGYWKTDGSDPQPHTWPAGYDRGDTFFLSNQTWQECLDTEPSVAQGYYQLAHQYIAAVLNGASGAYAPPAVHTVIDQAKFWFDWHAPSACADSNACAEQKTWAATLDAYNNGLSPGGPPHCD